MLHLRLATSAVLISVCLGLLYLDYQFSLGALCLVPMLLFFAIGTALDVTRLWRAAEFPVQPRTSTFAVALVLLLACVPYFWELFGQAYPTDCPIGRIGWIAIGAFMGLGAAFAVEMINYQDGSQGVVQRIQSTAFLVTYIGIPMSMLAAVRGLGNPHWGWAALISLIAATKIADTGAYFTGRAIGRHKLIPRLSPGKTIEGAVGGVLSSIGLSYCMFHWFFPFATGEAHAYPIWGPIVFGLVCALCGMFGDLAESLMKRNTGAKDSGSLLPGLGGVWDVTDSLIGTALPGYLCLLAGVAGDMPA